MSSVINASSRSCSCEFQAASHSCAKSATHAASTPSVLVSCWATGPSSVGWPQFVRAGRLPAVGRIEDRLDELGLSLPRPLVAPPGVELPFELVRIHDGLAYISGHGP